MAPNLSGIDAVDQPRSMHLAELALDMSDRVLKPGGTALIKVFQGFRIYPIAGRHPAALQEGPDAETRGLPGP